MDDDTTVSRGEHSLNGDWSAQLDQLQARLLAAGEGWLVWCAAHGVDPLGSDVDELERAALALRDRGGSAQEVLDLLDQVGSTTGMWRTSEWLHLRRTILTRAGAPPMTVQEFIKVPGGVLRTHGRASCAGPEPCPIHRPSGHPLRMAPMAWRADVGLLERICQHGVHHPDTDALAHLRRNDADLDVAELARHHCDGCCREAK
ncbi:hypothetical protein [Cellulomonas sp. Leaf395]|uniref:hypothetical protein n=1 Tax=Cellulomonas sp. Leaf395 TaxID=1736362 RepID=UPI0006F2476B|nr:hypothetical protein [Cellulomonas sp. Leaf395]KQS98720.1 hypothetical protein ASG23_13315 [Cellulomonas sp. Leaf395]